LPRPKLGGYLKYMARNPWEDDPDLQAFAGRRSGGMPWGRVLVGLVVVSGLTFVGAYYLPLFRAHDTLSAEHQRAVSQSKTLERSLTDAQAELQKAKARRDELEAEKSKRESGSASAASDLEGTRSELAAKFDKAIKKNLADVTVKNGIVTVSLADALVLSPKKLDVSGGGKQMLCDIAKAASARALWIFALDDGAAVDPNFAAKYPNAWALRSARASSLADTLETKCGVKPALLQALASARPTNNDKLPPTHFELEIRPDSR
jgi:chemotaxis protein MotB